MRCANGDGGEGKTCASAKEIHTPIRAPMYVGVHTYYVPCYVACVSNKVLYYLGLLW